jgi:hypothetical protein
MNHACTLVYQLPKVGNATAVMQDVVNAGKRRDLEQKAALAAHDALMRAL